MGKFSFYPFAAGICNHNSGVSTQCQRMLWLIKLLAEATKYTCTKETLRDTEYTTRSRRRRRRRRIVESSDVVVCNSELLRKYKRRKVMPSKFESCPINEDSVTQITDWLRDDKINCLGIHGMGGIGKTTVVKQVYSRLHHSAIGFSDNAEIAWVSVGLNFSIFELQQRISDAFGINLQGDNDLIRRAALLNAYLFRVPEPILFLDDLWEDFRREDVGIPQHCKLVLTTRLLDVCRIMRCHKIINVKPLTEQKSWELFLYTLARDDILNHSTEIEEIAKLLCRHCCGVPFAVNYLANSMKGVNEVSNWRSTLENLDQSSTKLTCLGDMITIMKKSYDNLSSSKLQKCFMFIGLYPNVTVISRGELIRLWIEQGLIGDVRTQQAQHDMAHSILNKLQNCCLLEATADNNGVKIHDLIRNMAISISKDRCHVI